MKNKYYYLLFLLFLLCSSSFAKEDYRFRTMSPEGGFYFDGVISIEQDYYGLIWVVMDDELYRFDGFEYKKYYAHFASIDNSKRWEFFNITSNSRGDLYVNTNNGLYSYDRDSDSFRRIYESVTTLIIDKADNLWVWTNNKWNILDLQTGELIIPLLNGEAISHTNTVFCMYNDDLYLFVTNKIYRYNYAKNELSLCCTLSENDFQIRQAKAYQGKLWIYANKYGLYKIDLSTFNIEDHFDFIPEENNMLRSFLIDKKGYIWLGTLNGLYILDPATREYSHYIHSEKDLFSLPNNSIWTIREDRQKNIWIGTYSGAICYVNIDENNAFKSYSPQNSELSLSPVSAFAEDNIYLWVGTEGGGINIVNKETGQFKYIANKKNLNSNNIKSLVTDAKHNFWAATFMGGLSCITYDHNKDLIISKHYNNIPEDSTSLLINDIKKIILESDSGLWIAYQNRKPQISYLSFKNEKFTHIHLDHKNNDKYIFDILKQNKNYLWALSSENLYRLDLETYDIEKFTLSDSIYATLYTFCLDASGYMWIGTIGNGIIKFDPATGRSIPLNDLLQNNIYSVYSICYDDGNIWAGTDNGLYCYNIAQNSLQKFDVGEGTQGQVYYPLASMKSKNGKLYFGGTNGLTVVDPKKIPHNGYKPKVIISDFLIDYVPTRTKTFGPGNENEIILNHNQTNFGFRFSSDNYLIPEKNRFKYRLKGYDNRWIETDTYNRTALYTKVPPGTYYFEIFTANNDGVWNDTPTIIKINRKPAPWLSTPAYIVYFIIVLIILFFILRYYNDKKKLEMQLYLENIEKQKKEELHQSQLRFFTNISHDFRTPLSLIIASLEKLRQEGLKEYYYRILISNAKRLLNLVNELMDFRTVENGKMKLELQSVNVNKYVKELGEDFTDYARQRGIDYNIVCDPELPEELFVDKNILEKVIMNLLNNAFKYTEKGGTIYLETHSAPFKSTYKNMFVVKGDIIPEQTFSIMIRDSGTGISEESLQFVFERFYKINTDNFDSNLSTGIGLALVKSLILLHRGIINVYSEKEKGTDISVLLSSNKNIYGKDNFIDVPVQDKDSSVHTHEKAGKKDSNDSLENDVKQILQKNKKRILIAEDNDDLRHLLSDYLSEHYEIIQAKDGVEASNLILQTNVDLIISDIMMPRKDGITFSKEIKENIETSHIPFMLLTAKTSLESKLEGADSGADFYFEKPIDLQLLLVSIHNIFNQQQKLKDYFNKNYWTDTAELCSNEKDIHFLKQFTNMVEENLQNPNFDVNFIASGLSMSRSKLYSKIKMLTGKSIVEFILSCRLRKAAQLLIEQTLSMQQIMDEVGIESPSYFSRAFKKEFGQTPSDFLTKSKNGNNH